MNSSAQRSQTARPSRLTNGFFSRSRKRDDLPAAGRMTAKRDMADLPLHGDGDGAAPLRRRAIGAIIGDGFLPPPEICGKRRSSARILNSPSQWARIWKLGRAKGREAEMS